MARRHDGKWVLDTSIVIANELKDHSEGTALHIRTPSHFVNTNTDGWCVVIGNLGKNKPRLEVWFDKFSGSTERKLYAGFWSQARRPMTTIINKVSDELWPVRVITTDDTQVIRTDEKDKYLSLKNHLNRVEFNAPILEKYTKGRTFFGVFDLTRETTERINSHFCRRAVAFFEDVARSLPLVEIDHSRIYPRYENRQQVTWHIQRERSRLLANDRKLIDNYQCQVCGMRFEDTYGKKLGEGFAEAHHVIPLSQLKGVVKTSIDDLRTVCANCHRMLHRMEGKREDIANLRKIVKSHR